MPERTRIHAQRDITKCLLLIPACPKTHPYKTALQAVPYAIRTSALVRGRRYDDTCQHFRVPILATMRLQGIPTHYQHTWRITGHTNGLYITMNKNMFHRLLQASHIAVGSWQQGGKLTLSELSSSLRTLSVPMNQRPFKASRRVRTTLIQHGTLGMRGVSTRSRITPLETPLMECLPCSVKVETQAVYTLPTSPRTHRTILVALPVCVGVTSSHTTKSLTGGVLSTFPAEVL